LVFLPPLNRSPFSALIAPCQLGRVENHPSALFFLMGISLVFPNPFGGPLFNQSFLSPLKSLPRERMPGHRCLDQIMEGIEVGKPSKDFC